MLIICRVCLPKSMWNDYLAKIYCCYLHILKYSYHITSYHHGICGSMLFAVTKTFNMSYKEIHLKTVTYIMHFQLPADPFQSCKSH